VAALRAAWVPAAGPLSGGLVTSAISLRASFGRGAVVLWVIWLARYVTDQPGPC